MKITNISGRNSIKNTIAFETAPRITKEIEQAFASLIRSRPELWRSPAFEAYFDKGMVFVSPQSVVKPEFVKTLESVLDEAEQAVNQKNQEAKVERTKQEDQTNAAIQEIAKTLGLPIKP